MKQPLSRKDWEKRIKHFYSSYFGSVGHSRYTVSELICQRGD